MDRWLLNTVPTWSLVVLFMVLPPALCYALALLVRRYRPRVADAHYSGTAGHLLTQLMAVFGFVLAFVIVNQYNDVVQARTDVQAEALNLEDLYRTSLAFEEPARQEMGAAVSAYAMRVVGTEWHALREGRSDTVAASDLDRMYVLLRAYEPTTPGGAAAAGRAHDYLHAVHEARHRRVDSASSSLPGVLAAFLLLGSAAVVLTCMLLGVRGHQVLVPLGAAGLLGFALCLSLVLEHPFSGDNAISSTHFRAGALAALVPPA